MTKMASSAKNGATLSQAGEKPSGQDWNAFWVARYRRFLKIPNTKQFPTDRDTVIGFLRSLKDLGKPAWQRLKAVQAIGEAARIAGLSLDAFPAIEEKLVSIRQQDDRSG